MQRRAFVAGMAAMMAAPLAAKAQQTGRVWRIGLLGEGIRRTDPGSGLSGFISGLRELGYIERRNLLIIVMPICNPTGCPHSQPSSFG
jgi:hypothetical protein